MFKTTKAKIIFVIIFSIMCIITTILLIWYQNIEIEEKKEDYKDAVNQLPDSNNVLGIDLKGTYNQNDLKFEQKAITQEKIDTNITLALVVLNISSLLCYILSSLRHHSI